MKKIINIFKKYFKWVFIFSFFIVLIFGIINVTFRPFSDEVINLDNFLDYYEKDLEESGGYSLLESNYYVITKIYDIKNQKILGNIEDNKLILNKPKKIKYEILAGDTLTEIAEKFNQNISIIIMNNPGLTANIKIGQIINIASINGVFYKIKKNDTLYDIAYKYKVKIEDIRNYNEIEDEESLNVGEEIFLKDPDIEVISEFAQLGSGFIMPVMYQGISSPYGSRFHPVLKRYIFHAGVDLRARYIPVVASRSGRVIFTGFQSGYGKIVKISHANGYETRYAHLNKIYVKNGQRVKQGQTIGQSGMTGRVTGPHLHFEIRKNGKTLNPMKILDR